MTPSELCAWIAAPLAVGVAAGWVGLIAGERRMRALWAFSERLATEHAARVAERRRAEEAAVRACVDALVEPVPVAPLRPPVAVAVADVVPGIEGPALEVFAPSGMPWAVDWDVAEACGLVGGERMTVEMWREVRDACAIVDAARLILQREEGREG